MASQRELVDQLFEAALALKPMERDRFLEQECSDDPELRQIVKELLTRDAAMGGFLQHPVVNILHKSGTLIGPYHLLELIGQGGMGEVWLALQREPVRRRVAIKLIKIGMDTCEVVARFESERQALALMDHPTIAKVFDAGCTPEGRPYFVMEYVAGMPITTYCDKHKLTMRQRLELFIHVCEGVQHAHQKAIIHRDLKPSNILVTEVDGKPAPRMIDFGVAKATSQNLNAATNYTRVGAIVGTLGYMSPEQADSAGQDLDTRTDVYSLGAVLYELLVGTLPLDFQKLAYDEVLRRLRDLDVPRPSARLLMLGDESVVTARNRGTDVHTLSRQLRGDPDAITLKALEKDRAQRYATPSELAADIGRFLRNEPVTAHPPSIGYRARKYFGRHRLGVAVAQPANDERKRSRGMLFAGFGLVLLILATELLVHRPISIRNASGHAAGHHAAKAESSPHAVPLTTVAGQVWDPAFSPDAKQIAFMWDGENPLKGDLYVQLVGGEKPLRLTHTQSGYLCCADWSPNGREIAFGRCTDNEGAVYVIPALGGLERKLTDVVCPFGDAGQPVWTTDGKSLVLADRCVPGGPRGIVLFSLVTGEKHCLTAPPPYADSGDAGLALSPEHGTIAFIRTLTLGYDEIYTIDLSGKNLRQVTHDGNGMSPRLMWTPDGQYIVFNSSRRGVARSWRVRAAGGDIESEPIYPAVGTLSHDGQRLAYVEYSGLPPATWETKLASPGGKVFSLKKVVVSSGENDSAQLSPDERQIVYRSNRSGNCDIWKSNADGSDQVRLTSFDNGWAGSPRWSHDGKWIIFDSRSGKHSQITLVDSEGRNQHDIVSGDYENVVPSWSRDGKALYFASNRTGEWQTWRRELTTGRDTQVTHHGGFAAFESYDTKTLYYSKHEGGGIWSMPSGGGSEERVTDALHRGYWGHFAVTDAGIYLLDVDAEPRPTIMFYSFQTRQLTPVLQLEEYPLPWTANLSASRDGRTLLFTQHVPQSSITMMENFR